MAEAAEARVQLIPELASDEETRRRAAAFIGAVATGARVEAPTQVQPIESLYQAIQMVAETGDEQALAMIRTNARTDAVERVMKAGHITKVDLMPDAAGRLQQYGQRLDSVQANALRFAAKSRPIRARTEAETRNAFRLQHHYDQGDLEDYYFVVFSRAADDMTLAAAASAGFFTDTMSCAVQVTDARRGGVVTETAFVAGVEQQGAERHDAETTVRVAEQFGVDFSGLTATEILDRPLLIPKSMLPNGAIDLVERWDDVRGTFFGQAKPRQDYQAYKRVCAEREARFEPQVQRIVEQLIKEAPGIDSPLTAARRLNKISAKYMLEQAIGDNDIDPRVFGEAAPHVHAMRRAYHMGQPAEVVYYYEQALLVESSSSCAGGVGTGNGENGSNTGESNKGPCSFMSKECPKCHKKNVWTTVTTHSISGDCGCRVGK